MRQYSVDRIVDNRVVLVDEKGATVEISACDLPSVQEGDLLTFDGEVGHADQIVKDAIRGAGGIVGSTALLKLTEKTLQSIRDASLELFLDRENGLSVRRGKER